MVEWYKKVFRAKIQHENEFLVFMTFDEERHRLVIFNRSPHPVFDWQSSAVISSEMQRFTGDDILAKRKSAKTHEQR